MTHIVSRIAPAAVAVMLALPCTVAQAQKTSAKKATHKAVATKPSNVVWKNAYTDSGLTVSLDPKATVRQPDGSYSAHLRWMYAHDQSIGRNETYRTMDETRLLDCDSLRTKPVRATTYSASGKKVSSYDTKPSEMQYLSWGKRKPGSANANAIAGVCQTIRKA